ncbi:helix-turn-helix transcriptional regulator [Halalkalirubrum salinum]|uniref:helix-turn-helix transcriptional regulator n=1 Tax=Halalkalirubrum salinum TaxID=2563889 RepID=UPI0010FAE7BF|nr:MarR family transcriptional regulator [Halalkalirubrum salinum]
MNPRQADTIVGGLLAIVLAFGGALSWQAYQQGRAIEESMGSMMDSSMGTMHGPDPLWYVFGTLLIVAVIGSVYALIRSNLSDATETENTAHADRNLPSEETGSSVGPEGTASTMDIADAQDGSTNLESNPQTRVLDLLPDDERRILEPVLQSPGITQIELRDRSDFSKSKVSQTVRSLEKRGLLYRERQGRTYRIYPSDDLQQQLD